MKISNKNTKHHGTQMTDLSVSISMSFLNNQQGVPLGFLRMMAVLILGIQTKNKEIMQQGDSKGEIHARKPKNVIHCYFKSNRTQSQYRRGMIKISEGYAKFDATSQRLA